jgi:hypothetical protein
VSARITLTRRDAADAQERQVEVSLDGAHLATLMYGDSVTRDVEPGRHRIRAHNTLVRKTVDVDLADGEEARFTVVNRPGRGTFGLLSILGARPLYLTIARDR